MVLHAALTHHPKPLLPFMISGVGGPGRSALSCEPYGSLSHGMQLYLVGSWVPFSPNSHKSFA